MVELKLWTRSKPAEVQVKVWLRLDVTQNITHMNPPQLSGKGAQEEIWGFLLCSDCISGLLRG